MSDDLILMRPGWHPIERVTQGFMVIDSNHAQVHGRRAFSVFVRIASLANGATKDFALTVPAAAYVHFQLATLSGNGSADLDIYEGSTLTKGAVVMDPQNRNRYKFATQGQSSVLTFRNVSGVTTLGTHIDGDSLYGSNSKAAAGRAQDENEWVMDETEYLVRVTGHATTGFDGMLRLFWYEESGV